VAGVTKPRRDRDVVVVVVVVVVKGENQPIMRETVIQKVSSQQHGGSVTLSDIPTLGINRLQQGNSYAMLLNTK
jgi:hypothetical protein